MPAEVELLIKLRHPDPYTDWAGFVNSLPESVIEGTQWSGHSANIQTKRDLTEWFLGTDIDVRDFLKTLQEYYEKQH